MKGLAKKYYWQRLGYNQQKEFRDCKTLYDHMGIVEINVVKENGKSFRVDIDDTLYKEVPVGWKVYDNDEIRHDILLTIVRNVAGDSGYYMERINRAIQFLDDNEREELAEMLKRHANKEAEQYYKNLILRYNRKLHTGKGWELSSFIKIK